MLRPVAPQFEVLVDFEVWGSARGRRVVGLGALPRRRALLPRGPAFDGNVQELGRSRPS
jgi:hypothetical protein